jgi:hypothetical protein
MTSLRSTDDAQFTCALDRVAALGHLELGQDR